MKTSKNVAIAALTLTVPGAAIAQSPGSLTPAECQTAATALANRGPSWQWERLNTCGVAGAQAFKTALTAARLTSDATFLSALSNNAAYVRDAGLLQTAMQLAEDNGATTAARVAGLLTVLSQYAAGIGPRERTFSQLVGTPIGAFCIMRVPVGGAKYMSDLGVTVADLQSASTRSAALAVNSSNAVVRDLARCVSEYVSFDNPVPTDPQLITLEYVCGTKYRVGNAGARRVDLVYQLFHPPERGDLSVPANGEAFLVTHYGHGLGLLFEGQVIRSAQNGGTTCPP